MPTKNRLAWLILLVGLGAGIPFALYLGEEIRTKSDEELIVEAWEEYRDAMVDCDFEGAWEAISESGRTTSRRRFQWAEEYCRDDPGHLEYVAWARGWCGLTKNDLLEGDPRGLFIWQCTVRRWTRPADWEEFCNTLEGVEIDVGDVEGSPHCVRFLRDGDWVFHGFFYKQGDQWFFAHFF